MKTLLQLFFLLFLLSACAGSESIVELSPQQSMLMTGKGLGQDAVLNPYKDNKSISVVKNLGKNPFSVRIQMKGEILNETEIQPKQTQEFVLEKGNELYLDAQAKGKAKVTFKQFE